MFTDLGQQNNQLLGRLNPAVDPIKFGSELVYICQKQYRFPGDHISAKDGQSQERPICILAFVWLIVL